jgi:Protein of unknown function (DUF2841)
LYSDVKGKVEFESSSALTEDQQRNIYDAVMGEYKKALRKEHNSTSLRRLNKRRKLTSVSTNNRRSSSNQGSKNQYHLDKFEISDVERLKDYLNDAFTSFQQINCRKLAKVWIRAIEPRKQVNFPYNARRKVKDSQTDSGAETTTEWWPPRHVCRHKEPDHLLKEGEPIS